MGRRTAPDASSDPVQRLDRWLWHARFARTRPAATQLVGAGHVRINSVRITNSARPVRRGDVLTIALGHDVRVLRVCDFVERRGSADVARTLYETVDGSADATSPAA